MQDNFEDKLKNAWQEKFSANEPLPGHEERFEMRLMTAQRDKKIRQIPRWPWITAAAAAIIGVIITIAVKEIKNTQQMADQVQSNEMPMEVAALQEIYQSRATLDISKLNTNDVNIQHFLNDMKTLEDEYKKLETVFASNFNNEKVAEAMVNNYKFRLKLMERLQKYIEIQNQIKNEKNTTENAL